MHWSSGGVAASQSALGWGPCPQKLWAGGQAGPGSVLGQVGRSALSLPREGLEALGGCLVCWWGRGLRRGLHVGEGGSTAVAGGGPHRGLQHLHGVTPLAAGAGDCIERCTWARQGAGQWGRVLPGGFGRPRFGFVILVHVLYCGEKRRGGQRAGLLLTAAVLPERTQSSVPWLPASHPASLQGTPSCLVWVSRHWF